MATVGRKSRRRRRLLKISAVTVAASLIKNTLSSGMTLASELFKPYLRLIAHAHCCFS
jgi:hypothetical protein